MSEIAAKNSVSQKYKELIKENEDWLMGQILYYAKQHNYAQYTSTLKEAWRMSIEGLSKPFMHSLDSDISQLDIDSSTDYGQQSLAQFGVTEARKHRERGIDLVLFLGLFKYYRQCYKDLLDLTDWSREDVLWCYSFCDKYFDLTEMAFINEWAVLEKDAIHHELQSSNRDLANEKNKFLTITESLYLPAFLFNSDRCVEYLNAAACELLGISFIPGKTYYGQDIVQVPEWLSEHLEQFCQSGNNESTISIDVNIDEHTQYFELFIKKMLDVSEKFSGITVVLHDVTDKEFFESELAQSEDNLRAFVEALPGIAYTRNIDYEFSFIHGKVKGITGYLGDDFLKGRISWENVIHQDERDRVLAFNKRISKSKTSHFSQIYKIIDVKGHIHWIEDHCWVKRFNEIDDVYVQGIILDVTSRQEAYQNLIANETFLKTVLTVLQAGLIVVDSETGYVIDANDTAEMLTKKSYPELLESDYRSWLRAKGEDSIEVVGVQNELQEYFIERDEHDLIPVNFMMKEVPYKGRHQKVLIFLDISKQKAVEQQLTHAQKLESIGSLAAGIAHEINTPIQYIGDNLAFLHDGFEVLSETIALLDKCVENCEEIDRDNLEFIKEEIPGAIDQSIDGTKRVATIVRAMKKFSHIDEDERQLFDINSGIQSTVTISKNEWKYVADMDLQLDSNLSEISGFPSELNQVFLNLIVNAAHAIENVVAGTEEKGKICIRTWETDQTIEVTVSDTGSGISPKNVQKIFDPFFTTKEVGKGTGQGLSIAYGIVVEKHKGRISVKSDLGKGTTFSISLPKSGV